MGLVAGRGIELSKRDSGSVNIGCGVTATQTAATGHKFFSESCTAHIGVGEVGVRQRSPCEVRIGEVLPSEVAAGKNVVTEVNSAQVAGLVAGRRVELGRCDSSSKWSKRAITK